MTLLVRNEEDILEANLEYHFAQGVDFVIATDHGSTDATPEILREYELRGLARVFRVEGCEHHQSRRVTHMARLAAVEYDADWVINNDADEFWWPATGRLVDAFAAIPAEHGLVTARRSNFLASSTADDQPFYTRLQVRERESRNLVGDPLEPKVAHRAHPQVVVAPGNHSVSGAPLAPAPDAQMFEVLHFPMRTLEQFERKVRTIGMGYETLPFRSTEVGRDQLKLLALQREGRLPAYFAEHVITDNTLAAGLQSGRLVVDRRLAQFMAELDGVAPATPAPLSVRAQGQAQRGQ